MPSPEHEVYLEVLTQAIRNLGQDSDRLKELKYYQDAVLLLCCLDLGPAKPILERCYSESPRGSTRYDPLAMFRLNLLGAAIGVMGINALVRRVRHSRVLAVLAGFPMDVNGEVRTPAVATVYDLLHPIRKDVHLDRATAVPLCEAGCTMAAWGTAGEGRTSFICPVKAGKIKSCPLARPEQPDWVCRPEQKYGPTVVMNVDDNPRLFPVIARNSKKFEDLYKKRPACERSNAFKKETGHIEDCGHRRWSFWLFRLYNLAIIQHARAWVARMNAEQNLLKLLELDEVVAKA